MLKTSLHIPALALALLAASVLSCRPGNRVGAAQSVLQNPVFNRDFPDPTVILFNNTYYAYATQARVNGAFVNIQIASSPDLQHWTPLGDALPQKPAWAHTTQDFWAPHVLYDEDLKKFVLFYSAESDDTATGKCLGVALADAPAGPFIDKGTPLICGKGFENIDPMALVDPQSGKHLLYWGSGFQPIQVQELAADWQSFAPGSQPVAVVQPGQERAYTNLIEGAWLDYADSTYYLYYSGDNCCGPGAHYAVMVAKSKNATGPFTRLGQTLPSGSSVILQRDSTWLAPGHNSIVRNARGDAFIAYHAIDYAQRKKGLDSNKRVMLIKPIRYKNGWPEVLN